MQPVPINFLETERTVDAVSLFGGLQRCERSSADARLGHHGGGDRGADPATARRRRRRDVDDLADLARNVSHRGTHRLIVIRGDHRDDIIGADRRQLRVYDRPHRRIGTDRLEAGGRDLDEGPQPRLVRDRFD